MDDIRPSLPAQLEQMRILCRVPRLRSRAQTYREELANSVSHGFGLFVAMIAAPLLVANALESGERLRIIAFGVYAATILLMYAASMIYHGLPRGRAKFVCRVIDHGAIFLLIAGTYTPFMLGVLWGPWGWTLLAFVWSFALVGVVLTAMSRVRYPTLSTVVYLMLGWLIIVGVKPLWERMNHWGLFWLAAGGFAYTAGVGFFAAERLRYGHLVWHVCVLVGSACHYIAVILYAFGESVTRPH
jgi:hemolysin III